MLEGEEEEGMPEGEEEGKDNIDLNNNISYVYTNRLH